MDVMQGKLTYFLYYHLHNSLVVMLVTNVRWRTVNKGKGLLLASSESTHQLSGRGFGLCGESLFCIHRLMTEKNVHLAVTLIFERMISSFESW